MASYYGIDGAVLIPARNNVEDSRISYKNWVFSEHEISDEMWEDYVRDDDGNIIPERESDYIGFETYMGDHASDIKDRLDEIVTEKSRQYMDDIERAGQEAILRAIPGADIEDFDIQQMWDTFYDTIGENLDEDERMEGFKTSIHDNIRDYMEAQGIDDKYLAELDLWEVVDHSELADKDGTGYRLVDLGDGEYEIEQYDPDNTLPNHGIGAARDYATIFVGNYNETLQYLNEHVYTKTIDEKLAEIPYPTDEKLIRADKELRTLIKNISEGKQAFILDQEKDHDGYRKAVMLVPMISGNNINLDGIKQIIECKEVNGFIDIPNYYRTIGYVGNNGEITLDYYIAHNDIVRAHEKVFSKLGVSLSPDINTIDKQIESEILKQFNEIPTSKIENFLEDDKIIKTATEHAKRAAIDSKSQYDVTPSLRMLTREFPNNLVIAGIDVETAVKWFVQENSGKFYELKALETKTNEILGKDAGLNPTYQRFYRDIKDLNAKNVTVTCINVRTATSYEYKMPKDQLQAAIKNAAMGHVWGYGRDHTGPIVCNNDISHALSNLLFVEYRGNTIFNNPEAWTKIGELQLLRSPSRTFDDFSSLADSEFFDVRLEVAKCKDTPTAILFALSDDPKMQEALLDNENLPVEIAQKFYDQIPDKTEVRPYEIGKILKHGPQKAIDDYYTNVYLPVMDGTLTASDYEKESMAEIFAGKLIDSDKQSFVAEHTKDYNVLLKIATNADIGALSDTARQAIIDYGERYIFYVLLDNPTFSVDVDGNKVETYAKQLIDALTKEGVNIGLQDHSLILGRLAEMVSDKECLDKIAELVESGKFGYYKDNVLKPLEANPAYSATKENALEQAIKETTDLIKTWDEQGLNSSANQLRRVMQNLQIHEDPEKGYVIADQTGQYQSVKDFKYADNTISSLAEARKENTILADKERDNKAHEAAKAQEKEQDKQNENPFRPLQKNVDFGTDR